MDCHLLLPELFWPAAAGADPYRELEVPALETLFARGRRERTAGAHLERWLARAFGLEPVERAPIAALALLGEGLAPGTDVWLRADPVHLKVHGTRLVLAEASRLGLERAEADELLAALNAHFGPRGIEFLAPRPERWYLRCAEAPRIETTPLSEVAGRPVEDFLPQGEDGPGWRALLNEVQMLLHEHPCNARREERGALPVNSVWLWGAGRVPRVSRHPLYRVVFGEHPLAAGIAAAGAAEARPLPADGAALLDQTRRCGRQGACLAVVEMPAASAYGDLSLWCEAALALERRWLAPLWERWRTGEGGAVVLHALGRDFGAKVTLARAARYRFWRRRRPLGEYV
jgi:hypothetical protein